MKKSLSIIIAVVLLSSCATPGQQAKTEGSAVGVGIGAALGAGIGAAICGADCAAIGAGVGGLVGGVGGYMYADSIDKQHQALIGKEHDLNTQLQVAKNINGVMQESNQKIQARIAEFDQDIKSLQAEASSQDDIKKELMAKKQQIIEEQNNVEGALASAKKELESIESFRSNSAEAQRSKELDDEYIRLTESYNRMKQSRNELAAMSKRI